MPSPSPPSWPSAWVASSWRPCWSTTAWTSCAAGRGPRHASVGPHARGRARRRRAVRRAPTSSRWACCPRPGIALLTRQLDAHGGVVISASHNPFEDNGIKIFSATGAKFPDAWEDEIESRLRRRRRRPQAHRGRCRPAGSLRPPPRPSTRRTQSARSPSTSAACTSCSTARNGATYRVAPRVFEALGARVTVLGAEPDGQNINRRCGALHPESAPGAGAAPPAPISASRSTATATA